MILSIVTRMKEDSQLNLDAFVISVGMMLGLGFSLTAMVTVRLNQAIK